MEQSELLESRAEIYEYQKERIYQVYYSETQ